MEFKTLTFDISSINRIFEMSKDCDKSFLYLHGTLQSGNDELGPTKTQPIHIHYYGQLHNIAGLDVFVSVEKRLPRADVLGIPANEPWKSNDDHRDSIRMDGLDKVSTFQNINLSIFLPPDVCASLSSADLNTCRVHITVDFQNTGENFLSVDNPSKFFFAYLSKVRVQVFSIPVEEKEQEKYVNGIR